MREHAVLRHQRRRRHLRDHEAGIEARLLHQERRQPAHLRIDQDRGAALGDIADLAQRHRELVGGERHRLGVEIAAGEDFGRRSSTSGLSVTPCASISKRARGTGA